MKGLLALGLGLLSLVNALPQAQGGGAAASARVSGTRFVIDGKTGYFAGTNSYWVGFLTNNKDVDTTLDHISASGLKILRVWGFNDVNTQPSGNTVWFQRLASSGSQINTGANGLQRLDYLVKSAETRGIKLIIALVNYWDDFGGMQAYVNAFGGTKESWYTNSRAQDQYKRYIQAVVSRYVNSPAIFAWELANEPRCKGCNTNVIFNWATQISDYIRSLDANHLITLGDEGFGLPGQTTYPYQYGRGRIFFGPGWIRDHAAACKAAGKPCLLEEYGFESDRCNVQKSWQAASRELAKGGCRGFVLLSTGQTHNDGFTIYYGSSLATCLVTDHVKAINSLPA
ncbi:GH5 endo-beta-1,4-mannanase [Apiosordaria backusii]|uniref:mannan endo-1,4-beta-mannosidase n=1 Tax=Apiosordaria backusii TaxID=314023 RepID=A0AA40ESW6_9PEZI|nr:GH5 endo-beta-1,4-mannanase [Apiosordaria backusii]